MSWNDIFATFQPLDNWVYDSLTPALSSSSLKVWMAITYVGDFRSLLLIIACISLWLALKRKQLFLSVWVVIGYIAGQLISHFLKYWALRPRPFPYVPEAPFSGYSFPSGHTAGSIVAALLLYQVWEAAIPSLFWRRVVQWSGIGAAILISFSRLALGVHWLSDVVGGVVVAAAWVGIWTQFKNKRL